MRVEWLCEVQHSQEQGKYWGLVLDLPAPFLLQVPIQWPGEYPLLRYLSPCCYDILTEGYIEDYCYCEVCARSYPAEHGVSTLRLSRTDEGRMAAKEATRLEAWMSEAWDVPLLGAALASADLLAYRLPREEDLYPYLPPMASEEEARLLVKARATRLWPSCDIQSMQPGGSHA